VLHLAVLALEKEAIREDAVVVEGTELPEVVAERQAAQVDDPAGGDEVLRCRCRTRRASAGS
jgi:hypothetical protein